MKLALGTANFGQEYGLTKKKVTKKEITKILNVCKNNNIRLIDTAINYGDAETTLGKFDLALFAIDSAYTIVSEFGVTDDFFPKINFPVLTSSP